MTRRKSFGLPIRWRKRIRQPPLETLDADELLRRQAILAGWAAERRHSLEDVRRAAGRAWQRSLREAVLGHVTIDYLDMRQVYHDDTLAPVQRRAKVDSLVEKKNQRLRETVQDVERQRAEALH